MKSFAASGADVTFVTKDRVEAEAIEWLAGVRVKRLPTELGKGTPRLDDGSRMKQRLRGYWGYEHSIHKRLTNVVRSENADAFVAVGLEALPYLDSQPPIKRIWYPADDPTLHAASLLKRQGVSVAALRNVAINIAYQRTFRIAVDAAWVVSARDRRWMQHTGGFRQVDVIPNGVDAEYYRPHAVAQEPNSCIFWGRLDFEPNVNALDWFLDRVWPSVISQRPLAKFHVCGSHPERRLKDRLTSTRGVLFHENLDDLRPKINASAVSVFPMVSGAGVKNKVLEAAAMATPVCGTQLCLNGLSTRAPAPLRINSRPADWIADLFCLWDDPSKRRQCGEAVRDWVKQHHSWAQSAAVARESIVSLSH